MPLFFFDVHDGDDHVWDHHGRDVPDLAAASGDAIRSIPDIARERARGRSSYDVVVDVRDGMDQVLFTATLSLVTRRIEPLPSIF